MTTQPDPKVCATTEHSQPDPKTRATTEHSQRDPKARPPNGMGRDQAGPGPARPIAPRFRPPRPA